MATSVQTVAGSVQNDIGAICRPVSVKPARVYTDAVLEPSAELFVYGSLKRGFSNHSVMAGAVFLGETRTAPGFELVSLGLYPALIVSGTDRVTGELYRVSLEHLARLDEFEGSEYERSPIELESGRLAHAYLLRPGHPAFAHAPRIGGTYRER